MTTKIYVGLAEAILPRLPRHSVDCCVTSPPYYQQRDYGDPTQLGMESTVEEYAGRLCGILDAVYDVLTPRGTLWLNLGDTYASAGGGQSSDLHTRSKFHKTNPRTARRGRQKELLGVPWLVAFELKRRGWLLRCDIIWRKPNPIPSSVTDRPTIAHEYLFLFAKQHRYYCDMASIKELAAYAGKGRGGSTKRYNQNAAGMDRKQYDTRNKRSVWTVCPTSANGAHHAVFPPELIRPAVIAGCPLGGTVLDPFGGSGTTGMVAEQEGRNAILIELVPQYAKLAAERIESNCQRRQSNTPIGGI